MRPEYQREFVYDDAKRNAVINTVLNGFPLNIMYFVNRQNGTYEVLDGQQRIISICRYYNGGKGGYSVKIPAATGGFDTVNYPNLFQDKKDAFLDYELTVYVCLGTDKEKLDWFQVINIAGEVLEQQEIRNALYHGPWLTSAKSAFSRRNCAAHRKYGKYMAGDYIRQKYLETVFSWKAEQEGFAGRDAIVQFMQAHRDDADANDLWNYYEAVFAWVQKIFGTSFDKSMKGVAWGTLYNAHKDDNLDPALSSWQRVCCGWTFRRKEKSDMSHLYGNIDLTVAGPQSEIQKVAGILRDVEYTREHEAGLRDEFLSEWELAVAQSEPDSEGGMEVNLDRFFEAAHIALQLIERIGTEFEPLGVFVSATMADSVTDEDTEFFARKEPGDRAWHDDDGLFEMVSWW